MKLKLVIIFVLTANAGFAATGYSSDLNYIVWFFISLVFIIIGIAYLLKFISKRRENRKKKLDLENQAKEEGEGVI